MATIRVNKTADYTVMSNTHLRDKEMSLKAKGLLSLMLSLPDNWDYSIEGLVAICKESETAVKSTLGELKKFGYLDISRNRTQAGLFDYVYTVYEKPKGDKPKVDFPPMDYPPTDYPSVDEPSVENVGQLNTNKLNTKKENTNKSNTDKQKAAYYDNDRLNEAFIEFIGMRKKIKKPLTDNAIKRAIKKLDKLAGTDDELAILIVEQSVDHCWQDFYPLKGNEPQGKVQTTQDYMNMWANA